MNSNNPATQSMHSSLSNVSTEMGNNKKKSKKEKLKSNKNNGAPLTITPPEAPILPVKELEIGQIVLNKDADHSLKSKTSIKHKDSKKEAKESVVYVTYPILSVEDSKKNGDPNKKTTKLQEVVTMTPPTTPTSIDNSSPDKPISSIELKKLKKRQKKKNQKIKRKLLKEQSSNSFESNSDTLKSMGSNAKSGSNEDEDDDDDCDNDEDTTNSSPTETKFDETNLELTNVQVSIVETETTTTRNQEDFITDEIVQVSKFTMSQTESKTIVNKLEQKVLSAINEIPVLDEDSSMPIERSKSAQQIEAEKKRSKEDKHEKTPKTHRSIFDKALVDIFMPKGYKKELKKEKKTAELTMTPPEAPMIPKEIVEMENAQFEMVEEPIVAKITAAKEIEEEHILPKIIEMPTSFDIDVEKPAVEKSKKEKAQVEIQQPEVKQPETKAAIEITLDELIPDFDLKKEKVHLKLKDETTKRIEAPRISFDMTAPDMPPIDLKLPGETKQKAKSAKAEKKSKLKEDDASRISCFSCKSRKAKRDLVVEERPMQEIKVEQQIEPTEVFVSDSYIDLDQFEIRQEVSMREQIEIRRTDEIRVERGQVVYEVEQRTNRVEAQNAFASPRFRFGEEIQTLNQEMKSLAAPFLPSIDLKKPTSDSTPSEKPENKINQPKVIFSPFPQTIEIDHSSADFKEIEKGSTNGFKIESTPELSLKTKKPSLKEEIISAIDLDLASTAIESETKLEKNIEKDTTASCFMCRSSRKPENKADKPVTKPSEEIVLEIPQIAEAEQAEISEKAVISVDGNVTKVIDICPIIDFQKQQVSAIKIVETRIDHQITSNQAEKDEKVRTKTSTLKEDETKLLKWLSKEEKRMIKSSQKDAVGYLIEKAEYNFNHDAKTDSKTKVKECKAKEKIITKLFKRIIKITTKERRKQITYEQFRKKLDKLKSSKLDSNEIDKCFELAKSELENETLLAYLKTGRIHRDEIEIPIVPAVIEIKPCVRDLNLDEDEGVKKLTLREANERARILFYKGRVPSIHYNDKRNSFRVSMLTQTVNVNGEQKTAEVPVNDQDLNKLLNMHGLFWNEDHNIELLNTKERDGQPVMNSLELKETDV